MGFVKLFMMFKIRFKPVDYEGKHVQMGSAQIFQGNVKKCLPVVCSFLMSYRVISLFIAFFLIPLQTLHQDVAQGGAVKA